MKQIKIFKSGSSYGGIVERRANEWIKENNIDVVDIRSSYGFWDGYKCEVIYTLQKHNEYGEKIDS